MIASHSIMAHILTQYDRGLNVIAFLMIFLWVPETKQRTLEELDYICRSPVLEHDRKS